MRKRMLMCVLGIVIALALPRTIFAQEVGPTVVLSAFPKDLQVYPRDLSTNTALVPIAGIVETPGQDSVILNVYRDNALVGTFTQALVYNSDGAAFSFAPEIVAELANYEFELYSKAGATEVLIKRAEYVVAGDVYLINGQSNAFAKRQVGSATANTNQGQFLRSFGRRDFDIAKIEADLDWHLAEGDGYWGPGAVGQWALRMGRLLVDTYQIPIAIINGAHGGKNITFFPRNDANPGDMETNYGRLLFRVQQAGVADSVRAMLWYQGEADGGRAEAHENGVIDLYYDWQEDYPNLEKIYTHQIRNSTCISFNLDLFERQRLLDRFDKLEVMSTTAVDGHDGCHFVYDEGYELIGEHMFNLIARDLYGSTNTQNIDPPYIQAAYRNGSNEVVLAMRDPDDTLLWEAGAEADFGLEGTSATVVGGSIDGNLIRLALSGDGSSATHVSYSGHSYAGPWVMNSNGVGLLEFRVALGEAPQNPPTVSVSSPTEGATFTQGEAITLAANAADSDGNVVQVAFYSNALLLGTATTAPWQITWSDAAPGNHAIVAVATDNGGSSTTSTPVNIVVNEVLNQAPTISITQPESDAGFVHGDDILISADAADTDGSVTQVDFYADSTLLGSDTAAPWQWIWSGAAEGSHALTAVATDNDNATTTSPAVQITVSTLTVGDVVLSVQPAVSQVMPGEEFNITVQVSAEGQGISGAAAYLDFDPAALTVLSVTPGNAFAITLQNEFDNATGHINISQGAELGTGNSATGTFTLATIHFKAQAVVQAPNTALTFSTTAPRQSEVTAGNTSLLSGTQNGSIVFTGAQLTGVVTFERDAATQSPPHPSWQAPLTVSLYHPGETTSPAYTFTPTTDANGVFHLYAIEPGAYVATVKHSHSLQTAQSISLVEGLNNIDFGTLREGDADDSNQVNIVDFSILANTFGLCQDAAAYDARADFNLSSCISLFDFSLLSLHYAETGEDASTPQAVAAATADPAAVANVDLRLLPSVATLTPGQSFDLTIQVEAGDQTVDAAAVFLDFDPALLKVLAVSSGDALPTQLRNVFDNQSGSLRYEAGHLGAPYPSGTFTLATVRFEVLAAAQTQISFSLDDPRRTQVYRAGSEHLRSATPLLLEPADSAGFQIFFPQIQNP